MLRAVSNPASPWPAVARNEVPLAGGWWIALCAYFGAHVVLRVALGDGLELDEAEQVLWTQQLALGYGTQPPLYTWLQWAVFQVLGVSVTSLALLKNGLLSLTYVFTFLAGRTLMPASLAALASASMLLIPQIGWESQRDLTHSVVCTTAAAATLWLVLALRQRPTPVRYLALGLVVGLGVLAKYSYAVFATALLFALLAAPETRTLLATRWTVAALTLALLVVLPHGVWLAAHLDQATQGTLAKMGAQARLPWPQGVVRGLGSGALAVLSFLTPLWLVLVALFVRRGAAAAAPPPGAGCGLLRRYLAALALLLLALVLAGAATQFKDRWMQPLLFLAPLAFFGCAPQLAVHPRLRMLGRLLAGWALLVLALIALRAPLDGWRDTPDELNLPARALAQALREAGFDGAAIVSDDRHLAGVLRLQFPRAHVHVVGRDAGEPPAAALWIARGDSLAAVEAALGRPAGTARTLALPPALAPASATPLNFVYGLVR